MKTLINFNKRSWVTLFVSLSFLSLISLSALCPSASATSAEEGTPSGAGMQAASAATTILYFPLKAAFALCGSVVGGLTYVFTAGDVPAAQSVWETSMYGTYAITPDHLRGDRPVNFLGERQRADSGSFTSDQGLYTEETIK
ncbi:MAG: hypothetical protein RBT11_18805 [Desulfobacterales bacterium]|jgi:hypothetical protein|nr:hypothetical protein [Desulfobacterales bacterium]